MITCDSIIRPVLLYVEDDHDDVELISLALTNARSALLMETVPDGASAIAYLSGLGKYADRERFPLPGIILLDLTLRGLNGFEVLRWMQNEPSGTMPPVIVFSYSKEAVDIQRAAELGATSFVTKPINTERAVTLVRMMEHYFAPSPSASAPNILSAEPPTAAEVVIPH